MTVPNLLLEAQPHIRVIIIPCPQAVLTVLTVEPVTFWAVVIRYVDVRKEAQINLQSLPASIGMVLTHPAAESAEGSEDQLTHLSQALSLPTSTCPSKGLKTTSLNFASK